MIYNRKCVECKKEFITNRSNKIYCSTSCLSQNYYKKNLKNLKESFKEWHNNKKEYHNKYKRKYYQKNKEVWHKSYLNNKNKVKSRVLTLSFIIDNPTIIIKKCKKCDSEIKCELHHEVYPITKEEIKKAVLDGKIYYLCWKHHLEEHSNIRNRTYGC